MPVVFIANKYLIGSKQILENLENEIINNKGAKCPKLEIGNMSNFTHQYLENTKPLLLTTVIGAAIVDSINPCAIAVF